MGIGNPPFRKGTYTLCGDAQSVQSMEMERASGKANRWDELASDWCPVARAMSVIGDRWTLLIVRDCFLGKSRFEQFQASLGVTRHVLSDRLKRLVEAGVLERNPYSSKPLRYEYVLSDKGRDFAPALIGLKDWGKKHMPIRKPAAV